MYKGVSTVTMKFMLDKVQNKVGERKWAVAGIYGFYFSGR